MLLSFCLDVVRPELAGTKEKPDYNLSSDFLKSRAAIFNAPPPKQYTPRNKVNTIQDNVPRVSSLRCQFC